MRLPIERLAHSAVLALALAGCATTPPSIPSSTYQVEQLGPLLPAAQMAGVFPDSKTLVDAVLAQPPAALAELYTVRAARPGFKLPNFVTSHFTPMAPPPTNVPPTEDLASHIDSLWPLLTRNPKPPAGYSTLLPLPQPYVVPGGRFTEMYYWDSYFTLRGLAASGRRDLVDAMVANFAHLIDTHGFIPNGTRTYYLTRSQPPFFGAMLNFLAETAGEGAAARYYPALQREYSFWMAGAGELTGEGAYRRLVRLPNGGLLNRYYDDADTPRPESYREDVALAENLPRANRAARYRHIRAAAESGWDFSTRWLAKGGGLDTIHTLDIVPVDLNALLFHTEQMLARLALAKGDAAAAARYARAAQQRREAMDRWLWREDTREYRDYDFVAGAPTHARSLAMVYPLYFGAASAEQARAVASHLRADFLKAGGLVTTLVHSGEQWDAPNGWAPLQWLASRGLRRYGETVLADSIESRWLALNEAVFEREGKLLEKYNVIDIGLPGGGGEYPNQDGFGWTNGVARALIAERSEDKKPATPPPAAVNAGP